MACQWAPNVARFWALKTARFRALRTQNVTTVGQHTEHTVAIQMRHDAFEDRDLELAFNGGGCDTAGLTRFPESCRLEPAR